MEILKAIVFGILQGLTEFLPVSSSGHLSLFNKLFGYTIEEEFLFPVIAVHTATLAAVLLVFRRDIVNIFTANRKLIVLLIVGTIPAGIFGFCAQELVEQATSNMIIVGMGFITTAFFLLSGSRQEKSTKNLQNMKINDSISIGLAQALAILPGVSRSGSTIAMAQKRGLDSNSGARFSFLLMIPAVGGAALLDFMKLLTENRKCDFTLVGISFIAALITGIISLKLLLNLLSKGKFYFFAYYLIPLGLICLLLQLFS